MKSILMTSVLAILAAPAQAEEKTVQSYIEQATAIHGDKLEQIEWYADGGYYWVNIAGGAAYDLLNYGGQRRYLEKTYCAGAADVAKFAITIDRKYHALCD